MKYFSEKALEKKIEAIGGGGKTYSAGAGLDLNDTVFSIKDSVLAEIAKISDWFELKDGNIHVRNNRGFWTGGFISAGGLSSGGGAAAGNATLSNVTANGATISADGVGSIDVYSKSYLDTALAQAGKVQSVVGQTGAVTAAQIGSALISEGYELTDHTYTNGTGLSLVGGEFSISTEYQTKIQSGKDAYTDLHNWFERINVGTEADPVWVIHIKSDMGFYGDSFVSAGGISSGGGASAGNATLVAQSYGGTLSATGIDPINFYSKERVDQLIATAGTVQTVAGVSPTSGDIPVASLKSALGLGAAAEYGIGSVASGNTGLVTGGSVYSAINEAVSSVMKMQGTTTTPISDGSTTNPVVIDGSSYTAKKGDVVLYDGKEYLWAGSAWEQLGDEASWALKTTSISAGTGLEGGGTLASNRTISLSAASIASLALADSAYQKPSTGIPQTDLASALSTRIDHGESAYNSLGDYLPLSAGTSKPLTDSLYILTGDTDKFIQFSYDANHRAGAAWRIISQGTGSLDTNYLTFQTGGSSASATDWLNVLRLTMDTRRVGIGVENPAYALDVLGDTRTSGKLYIGTSGAYLEYDSTNGVHLVVPSGKGFYTEGFISAGGVSSGGGAAGINLAAMWASLTNNSADAYASTKIATAHIPDMASTYGYLKSADAVANVDLNGDYLRVTKNGGNTDLTIPYALRAGYVDGTNSGNWDANSPGNYQYLWFYGQEGGVSNFPANLVGSYGSVVNFLSYRSSGSLHAQLAWGINHNSTNVSNGIAWRAKNNLGWDATWHRLYDDNYHPTADNASTLNGQPGSYYAAASSLSYYLPLTGGTLKNANYGGILTIWRDDTSNDAVIVYRNNTGVLGHIGCRGSDGVPYYSPDSGASTHFLLHSGNYSSYALPLSGGTMTGAIQIGAYTAFGVNGSTFYLGSPAYPVNLRSNGTTQINGNTIWHSDNSNNNNIPWTCSILTVNAPAQSIYTAYINGDCYCHGSISASSNLSVGVSATIGGALTSSGGITASSGNYGGQLTIKRADVPYDSVIRFENSSGFLGHIGMMWGGYPYWTNDSSGNTIYRLWATDNAGSTSNPWACSELSLATRVSINESLSTKAVDLGMYVTDTDYNRGVYFIIGTSRKMGMYSPQCGWLNYVDTDNVYYQMGTCFTGGHIYLTGADPSSSVSNTTQLVFGTPSSQQVAITSNSNALVLNPDTASTSGQVYFGVGGYGSYFSAGNLRIGTVADPGYRLYVSGDIVATGAITAGSASDARLKTNIQSLSADAAKHIVMALNPVTFTWKSTATELYDQYKGNDLGFIAQEVEPYLPQAIGTIFEKYKRLDYTKFITPLVAVVQDHETRIRQLERENAELKRRLNMN